MDFIKKMFFINQQQKTNFLRTLLKNPKNPKGKEAVTNMFLSGDLFAYSYMKKYKFNLNVQELEAKNLKFLMTTAHTKPQLLKNFLRLNPYVGKKITQIPVLAKESDLALFKTFLKNKKIKLAIDLEDHGNLLNILLSCPKSLKLYKFEPNLFFIQCLNKLRGKRHFSINKKTLKSIIDSLDKKELFKTFPMLEYFLKDNNFIDNFGYIIDLSHTTNMTTLKLTDYIKDNFGVKSSNVTNLFLKSNEKHKVILLGDIGKKSFVEKNKINYALELLEYPLSDRQYYSLYYARIGLKKISSVLTPEQFKTILHNFLSNQNLESIANISRDLEQLAQVQFKIDTKFSNINTIEKLEKYLNLKSLKAYKANEPIKKHIKIDETKVLKNDLKVILPKTTHDLIEWGWELENCLGTETYDEQINYEDLILVGVIKSGKLTYCLEIDCGELDYDLSLGKRNTEMNFNDYKIVKKYLEPILKKYRAKKRF